MHVLLVEDDHVLGKAIRKGLSETGHECEWVGDGESGLRIALETPFDAIVLDLMLPDRSGLEVLEQLRSQRLATPVMVLTALGSVDERVAGLNAGADDYLVKPFAFVEFTARLEALYRRSRQRPGNQLQLGSISLDLSTRRVTREKREIDLTPTEFSLLEFLMRHAGQVVTRKMLCEHLWESDWEGVTNVIEVHINRLRSKIDKGFEQPLIHTVRGRGYLLRAN